MISTGHPDHLEVELEPSKTQSSVIGWQQYQKTIRHKTGRQHHLVDVLVFDPGGGALLFGGAPDCLDLVAQGEVLHECLQLCALPRTGGSVLVFVVSCLMHAFHGMQPDCKAEFAKCEPVFGRQLQLSALCVVLQTGERRIEEPVQQLRVWSCALLHELLHAVGIDQQAAQAKRIGGG